MITIKNHKIRDVYVPYKMIYKNSIYKITNLDRKFVIRDIIVKTVDNKIDMVFINSPHPNANPNDGEFCIPNYLREHELNKKSLETIRLILCCFNLDDCYFTPWNEIEYEKQEDIRQWKTK